MTITYSHRPAPTRDQLKRRSEFVSVVAVTPGSEDEGEYISGGVSKAQIRVKISSPDLSRSEDGGELHRSERGDFQWTEQDS